MLRTALLAVVLLACSCSKSTEPAHAPAAVPAESPATGSAAPAPAPTAGSGSAIAAGSATETSAAGSGSSTAPGSGSSAAAGSGAADGSAATGEVANTGFDFDKLSHDDKVKFMKTKVTPAMKVAFQAFDKTKYADFGCKTCHGKNPQKKKYKMPNPELPKLDFAALEAGKQKPEVAKFMAETVKPQMAKLLNQPEMTKSHPDGFGCLECHQKK